MCTTIFLANKINRRYLFLKLHKLLIIFFLYASIFIKDVQLFISAFAKMLMSNFVCNFIHWRCKSPETERVSERKLINILPQLLYLLNFLIYENSKSKPRFEFTLSLPCSNVILYWFACNATCEFSIAHKMFESLHISIDITHTTYHAYVWRDKTIVNFFYIFDWFDCHCVKYNLILWLQRKYLWSDRIAKMMVSPYPPYFTVP